MTSPDPADLRRRAEALADPVARERALYLLDEHARIQARLDAVRARLGRSKP